MLRNATFKIIYTQTVFFESHLEVLHALRPDVIWDWWPINVHKLFSKEKQQELHRYFSATDKASVATVLISELDSFSADARAACEAWNLEYPAKFEAEVRQFIADSGCLMLDT
jgi:hypothetical protein